MSLEAVAQGPPGPRRRILPSFCVVVAVSIRPNVAGSGTPFETSWAVSNVVEPFSAKVIGPVLLSDDAKEKPAREVPIPTSYSPLKSAVHSMNDVDGLASGPKTRRPPAGSPQPTGVPIEEVSIVLMSEGTEMNRSYRVPPVAPLFCKVKLYKKRLPFGVTEYERPRARPKGTRRGRGCTTTKPSARNRTLPTRSIKLE